MFGRKTAEQKTMAKTACQKVTERRIFHSFYVFFCHLSKGVKQQTPAKPIQEPHYPENYPQI